MAEEDRGPAWTTYGADQAAVEGAVRRVFGDKIMDSTVERGSRVFEEAAELAQVEGVTEDACHRIVSAKFSKPRGELRQEVGGLTVTLLALCAHHDMRLDDVASAEIVRLMNDDPGNVSP